MPNGKMGPEAPKSPEIALEQKADQTSRELKETAETLLREEGESAAAEYLATIGRLNRMIQMRDKVTMGDEEKGRRYVSGIFEIVKALSDSVQNAEVAGANKIAMPYAVEKSITPKLRKLLAEELGGDPDKTSAYGVDEKKL